MAVPPTAEHQESNRLTKRMLINAQTAEELRIAVLQGTQLEEFQLEAAERGLLRGNIYRGIVQNLQPSLNAAFIEFGDERHGFLPAQDIVEQAYHRKASGDRPRITEVLERGKPILVQVTKDPEGQKGAALTTNLSLAGRYLVLTPYDDTRGVSRKVEDEDQRKKLRDQVLQMKIPAGAGFIVRTNAVDQTKASLTRDFNALMRAWKKIQTETTKGSGPALLHSDQDAIIRTLRDYLDPEISEIIIDDEAAFERAETYIRTFLPRGRTKLIRYVDRVPLFTKFDVEPQVDRIFDRTVPLPSGGSIVIDRTEALVAIDVNSGKTHAATHEQMALQTNLDAAREVSRQLRLRDIGGLIVVDFIDMRSSKNRAAIEKSLKDSLKTDKARTNVGRISSNGLLEINRQRIRQALVLRTHRPCPTCDGTGRIASREMVAVNLLRRIEAKAAAGSIDGVRVALHPELADAFQNRRRREIADLETEFGISVEIIASYKLHRPEQEIEWIPRTAPLVVTPATAEKPAAPLTQQQHHPATPEHGEGKRSKKRKRRHRGERETTDAAHPIEPALEVSAGEPAMPSSAVEATEEPHEPTPLSRETAEQKRSRRRRRRRRGEHRVEDHQEQKSVDGPQPEPDVDVEPQLMWLHSDDAGADVESPIQLSLPEVAPAEQASPEPPAGEHKRPRKRRRRKRSHDPSVSPHPENPQEHQEPVIAETAAALVDEVQTVTPEETHNRPRRRRPRAKRPSKATTEPAAAVSDAQPPVASDAATPAAHKPKRRRRKHEPASKVSGSVSKDKQAEAYSKEHDEPEK